jgi:O-methyltransferase
MNSLLARVRSRFKKPRDLPPDYNNATQDVDPAVLAIYERVRPYTMTNLLRVNALVQGVQHVVQRGVPGAFVECGVWRGGSVLAMLLKLQQLGAADRDIYLYDTYDGMTAPDEKDTSPFEQPALVTWQGAVNMGLRAWHHFFKPDIFSFEQVKDTVLSTGYPAARIHFVKGDVRETIPAQAPETIALLRLDTDWYDSTRHELLHLYPRLGVGGVLLIDDYGHWDGCRKAVDEYFSAGGAPPLLLNRVDYAARLAIKH